jgi:hypothetical protein
MSKVKITGHASGSGTLTLTGPNTNSDRTLTIPDITGTLLSTEGAVTINEGSADVDFRVEGNNETHAFFLQGSEGRIGINHSTPDARLEIHPASETGLQVTSSVAGEVTAQFKGAGTGNVSVIIARDSADASLFDVKQTGRAVSQFTANAWCAFNATGTPAIRDSHNVSSIGDNGTGWFYVYIDVDLANANSACVASASNANNTYRLLCATSVQVTTAVYVMCSGHSTSDSVAATDPEFVNVVVFGD